MWMWFWFNTKRMKSDTWLNFIKRREVFMTLKNSEKFARKSSKVKTVKRWCHENWLISQEKASEEVTTERLDMTSSPVTKHAIIHDLTSFLLFIIAVLSLVNANSDHCKDRKFANTFNTTYMQFTKEIVSEEYAIEGEFKNLHCCAKGYRSIEW